MKCFVHPSCVQHRRRFDTKPRVSDDRAIFRQLFGETQREIIADDIDIEAARWALE